MNNQSPLISIIVAVRNGATTLARCIDSVTEQTWAHKELIVIDGDSSDGTLDVIKARASEIKYWLSEPDSGVYNAWNKALRHARGDWIVFLGADDYFWTGHALERMAPYLNQARRQATVVYGQVAVVSQSGKLIDVCGGNWNEVKARFRDLMAIPHQAVMHHRSLFEAYGNFSEHFRIAGDYELLLRELGTRDALFVPEILTAMQHGGMSSKPENSLLLLREIRQAQKMHGVSKIPGFGWWMAVVRVRVRYLLQAAFGDRLMRKMLDAGRAMMGKKRFWTRTG